MKNKILAICDLEENYACRLAEYITQRKGNLFRVQAFSDYEELKKFALENYIEILLISNRMIKEELRTLEIGKILILSEGGVFREYEMYPSIYKYQSSENIIREVLCYYAESAKSYLQIALLKKEVQIIGIYSPIQRVGKTSFALALGQVFAEKVKTLYLNLESYSGFESLIQKDSQWTLADLIYFMKQGKTAFLYKTNSMVQSFGLLDYIPPMQSPVDIQSTTREEWELLLEQLVLQSDYEVIVLDIGDAVDGVFELLGKCKKIYMPVRTDIISKAKVEQCENNWIMMGLEKLSENMEKIVLPQAEECVEGHFAEKSQMDTKLGEFVRSLNIF